MLHNYLDMQISKNQTYTRHNRCGYPFMLIIITKIKVLFIRKKCNNPKVISSKMRQSIINQQRTKTKGLQKT